MPPLRAHASMPCAQRLKSSWEAGEDNRPLLTPRVNKHGGQDKVPGSKSVLSAAGLRPHAPTTRGRRPVCHYYRFYQSILSVYIFSSCQRHSRKQRQTKLLRQSLRRLIPFEQNDPQTFLQTTHKKALSTDVLDEPKLNLSSTSQGNMMKYGEV